MSPVALEWIARFRRYLNSERRLSAHTDHSYARDLAALVKFCDREGIEDWSALDPQHVRSFAAHSHRSGLAPRSIQRRLSALRSFYNFLLREAASESARTATAHTPQAGAAAERRRAHTEKAARGVLDRAAVLAEVAAGLDLRPELERGQQPSE